MTRVVQVLRLSRATRTKGQQHLDRDDPSKHEEQSHRRPQNLKSHDQPWPWPSARSRPATKALRLHRFRSSQVDVAKIFAKNIRSRSAPAQTKRYFPDFEIIKGVARTSTEKKLRNDPDSTSLIQQTKEKTALPTPFISRKKFPLFPDCAYNKL